VAPQSGQDSSVRAYSGQSGMWVVFGLTANSPADAPRAIPAVARGPAGIAGCLTATTTYLAETTKSLAALSCQPWYRLVPSKNGEK
jgi:hypothetical protein